MNKINKDLIFTTKAKCCTWSMTLTKMHGVTNIANIDMKNV